MIKRDCMIESKIIRKSGVKISILLACSFIFLSASLSAEIINDEINDIWLRNKNTSEWELYSEVKDSIDIITIEHNIVNETLEVTMTVQGTFTLDDRYFIVVDSGKDNYQDYYQISYIYGIGAIKTFDENGTQQTSISIETPIQNDLLSARIIDVDVTLTYDVWGYTEAVTTGTTQNITVIRDYLPDGKAPWISNDNSDDSNTDGDSSSKSNYTPGFLLIPFIITIMAIVGFLHHQKKK